MIKMLVLDIDGTIFKKDYTASEKVKETLKMLASDGIKVVLCTGRMYAATKSIAEELELTTPVICYQGGLVKEIVGNYATLHEKTMPTKQAREVINILKKQKIFFNLYINDVLMVEEDNYLIKQYVDARNIEYKVIGNCDNLDLNGLNKILAIDDNTELIKNLQENMAKKFEKELYVVRSTPRFCEFSNIEATKGKAVRFLAEKWNIKKEEIMACGDNDNDIEMLLEAGTKIAMGNATEKLKEIADFVTKTVDEDGVAYAITKFIGEKYAI